MKRQLVIIFLTALLLTGLFYTFTKDEKVNEPDMGYSFPQSEKNFDSDFAGGIIGIQSLNSNEILNVSGNFSSSDVEELSDDYNRMFTPQDVDESKLYGIFYDEVTKSILVTIFSEPISEVRNKAVARLKEKLGVSSEEICKFDISVITNSYVSPFYAGVELGIPGCPNAVVLE